MQTSPVFRCFAVPALAFALCATADAKPFAQCVAANSDRALEAKINAIPRDDTVMLLRGAVVGIDFQIGVFSQCLPDDQARQYIDNLNLQRTRAIETCRSIASSPDLCTRAPF